MKNSSLGAIIVALMPVVPGFRVLSIQARSKSKLSEVVCERIGAGLEEGSKARIYPGKTGVKIKSISTSGKVFYLKIKGAKRSMLIGGAIIVSPEWPIEESRELLLLSDGHDIPEGAFTVRGGPYAGFNREGIIGPGSFFARLPFVAVKFPTPYPAFPGAQLSVHGGDPRRFTVLWPGRLDEKELKRLYQIAKLHIGPHSHPSEIYRCILHLRGCVNTTPFIRNKISAASLVGTWLVLEDKLEFLKRKILKIASRPGGADAKMMRVEGFPAALILAIARELCSTAKLQLRNGWFSPPGKLFLSHLHKAWLKRVQEAGTEGIRVSVLTSTTERTILEELSRAGLVKGGERLWFSIEASEALSAILLSGKKKGDKISMPYARKILAGSRNRTLELLHIMESERRLSALSDNGERIICQ